MPWRKWITGSEKHRGFFLLGLIKIHGLKLTGWWQIAIGIKRWNTLTSHVLQRDYQTTPPWRLPSQNASTEENNSNSMKCGAKTQSSRRLFRCSVKKQGKGSKMQQVHDMLSKLRGPLRKLNRDRFADIHEQQRIARLQLERVQSELYGNPRDEVLLCNGPSC